MTTRALKLLLAGPAALLLIAAACTDESDDTPGPTATPAETQGIAIGEPTPPGGRPTETPTETPSPEPDEAPAVQWLTLNHAGAGAVALVFETNVPTTASAQGVAVGNPDNERPLPPETDGELDTYHVIALGNAGLDMMWEVTVTDGQGRKAIATIESGAIVQEQYWARTGEFVPKVTLDGSLRATATWSNLYGQDKPAPGKVIVVARKTGCTTAEACLGEPVGTFEGDDPSITPDKVLEQHAIRFEFPDNTHDCQILLVGEPAGPTHRAFYQIDFLVSDLK